MCFTQFMYSYVLSGHIHIDVCACNWQDRFIKAATGSTHQQEDLLWRIHCAVVHHLTIFLHLSVIFCSLYHKQQ